jgi:hypothetical protein
MALACIFVLWSRIGYSYFLVPLYLERKKLTFSNNRINLTRNIRVKFFASPVASAGYADRYVKKIMIVEIQ